MDVRTPPRAVSDDRLYHSVMLEHWEDQIDWGGPSEDENMSSDGEVVLCHTNQELDNGDWLDAVIWDREKPSQSYMKISLDLNDPHMLFDCEEVEATKAQMVEAKQVKKGRKPLPKPLPKVGSCVSLKEKMGYNIDHVWFRFPSYTARTMSRTTSCLSTASICQTTNFTTRITQAAWSVCAKRLANSWFNMRCLPCGCIHNW